MNKCAVCDGKGRVSSECVTCGSKGTSLISLRGGHNLLQWYPCHDCGNYRCAACGGDGFVPTPVKPQAALRVV